VSAIETRFILPGLCRLEYDGYDSEDCHGLGTSLDLDKTELKAVKPIEEELREPDCALRHRLQEITSLRSRLVRLRIRLTPPTQL
jgi:hypothetical protein